MTALKVSGVCSERVKLLGRYGPRQLSQCDYVLYCMNGSIRAKQNEALELAKAMANEVKLPLLVLAVVDLEHYRIGSMRHVNFLLEGTLWFLFLFGHCSGDFVDQLRV